MPGPGALASFSMRLPTLKPTMPMLPARGRVLEARAGTTPRERGGRWASIRKRVLARDLHTCQACGRLGDEVDHIVPLSKGGTDVLTNLQVLCKFCHSRKTASEHPRRGA